MFGIEAATVAFLVAIAIAEHDSETAFDIPDLCVAPIRSHFCAERAKRLDRHPHSRPNYNFARERH